MMMMMSVSDLLKQLNEVAAAVDFSIGKGSAAAPLPLGSPLAMLAPARVQLQHRYVVLLSSLERALLASASITSPVVLSVRQKPTTSPSDALAMVTIPVNAIAAGKPLPQFIMEGWTVCLDRVLSDDVARQVPITASVRKLVDAIKLLGRDRSEVGDAACCLDAALHVFAVLLHRCPSACAEHLAGVSPVHFPHPTKSVAQAPRLSAFAVLPHFLAAQSFAMPSLSATAAAALSSQWLTYLLKGLDSKDFAVREAAAQALADAASQRSLTLADPQQNLTLVESLLHRYGDGAFTSPKLLASIAAAIGEVLASAEASDSPPMTSAAASSNSGGGGGVWGGLWRTSSTVNAAGGGGSSNSTATSSSGGHGSGSNSNPWKIVAAVTRSPMTKTVQSVLGEALGVFLSRSSRRRPLTFLSGVDHLMQLLVPVGDDSRAYVPKIVTKALRVWLHGADSDACRNAALGRLARVISDKSTSAQLLSAKLVLPTALTALTELLPAMGYVRPDIVSNLLSSALELARSNKPHAAAAADVVARLVPHDANAFQSVTSEHCEMVENDPIHEQLSAAFVGLARICLAIPDDVLSRHSASSAMEVQFSMLLKLKDGFPTTENNAAAAATTTTSSAAFPPGPVAMTESLVKRMELTLLCISKLMRARKTWHTPALELFSNAVEGIVKLLLRATESPSSRVHTTAPWLRVAAVTVSVLALFPQQELLSRCAATAPVDGASTAASPTAAEVGGGSATCPTDARSSAALDAPATRVTASDSERVTNDPRRQDERASVEILSGLGRALYSLAKRCLSRGDLMDATVVTASLAAKLKAEVFQAFARLPSLWLASSRVRAFVASAALFELSSCTAMGIPCARDDQDIFPQHASWGMGTCRRTAAPSMHVAHATSLSAALIALGCVFSHADVSVGQRNETIAAIFDVLTTRGSMPGVVPPAAAATVDGSSSLTPAWNVICALDALLRGDMHHGEAFRERERSIKAWRHMQATARTLRSQLLSHHFCASGVLDIQLVAAKVFGRFALLVGEEIADVARIALEHTAFGSRLDSDAAGPATIGGGGGASGAGSGFTRGGGGGTPGSASGSGVSVASRCGTVLLLAEHFSSPEAPAQQVPLLTSHLVNALRHVDLFGDPCTAFAISVSTAMVILAGNNPDVLSGEVVTPHLIPHLLRPSARGMDPLVGLLLRSLMVSLADPALGAELDAMTWLFVSGWCHQLPRMLEGTLLASSLATLQHSAQRLRSCQNGISGFQRVATESLLQLRRVPLASIAQSDVQPAALMAVGGLLVDDRPLVLDILRIAQRVDQSFGDAERSAWTAMGSLLVHKVTDCKLLFRALLSIASSKAPVITAAMEDEESGVDAVRTAESKSEAYGEYVEEEAGVASSSRRVASSRDGTSDLNDTAATSAAFDTPAKAAAGRWLTEYLLCHSECLESDDVLDGAVRVASVLAALADVHHALVPRVVRLLSTLLEVGFERESLQHRPSMIVHRTSYRAQIGGALRQVLRVVPALGGGSASEASNGASTSAFYAARAVRMIAQSVLADDTLMSRIAQAVLQRVVAVEESALAQCQFSDESEVLLDALAASLSDCRTTCAASADGTTPPPRMAATRKAIASAVAASSGVQRCLVRMGHAALGQWCEHYGGDGAHAGGHYVSLQMGHTVRSGVQCGTGVTFMSLLSMVCADVGGDGTSAWMGPSLRNVAGGVFCAALSTIGHHGGRLAANGFNHDASALVLLEAATAVAPHLPQATRLRAFWLVLGGPLQRALQLCSADSPSGKTPCGRSDAVRGVLTFLVNLADQCLRGGAASGSGTSFEVSMTPSRMAVVRRVTVRLLDTVPTLCLLWLRCLSLLRHAASNALDDAVAVAVDQCAAFLVRQVPDRTWLLGLEGLRLLPLDTRVGGGAAQLVYPDGALLKQSPSLTFLGLTATTTPSQRVAAALCVLNLSACDYELREVTLSAVKSPLSSTAVGNDCRVLLLIAVSTALLLGSLDDTLAPWLSALASALLDDAENCPLDRMVKDDAYCELVLFCSARLLGSFTATRSLVSATVQTRVRRIAAACVFAPASAAGGTKGTDQEARLRRIRASAASLGAADREVLRMALTSTAAPQGNTGNVSTASYGAPTVAGDAASGASTAHIPRRAPKLSINVSSFGA